MATLVAPMPYMQGSVGDLLHTPCLQLYRMHQYEQQALAQRLTDYTERNVEQAARQREAREAAKAVAAAASREARLEAIQRAAAVERAKQQRVSSCLLDHDLAGCVSGAPLRYCARLLRASSGMHAPKLLGYSMPACAHACATYTPPPPPPPPGGPPGGPPPLPPPPPSHPLNTLLLPFEAAPNN